VTTVAISHWSKQLRFKNWGASRQDELMGTINFTVDFECDIRAFTAIQQSAEMVT
jgi:hypothetical protein